MNAGPVPTALRAGLIGTDRRAWLSGTALRAWGLSALALIAAGAGMSVLTATSATTSRWQMAVAAAVLSVYAAAIGVLFTDRESRTRARCLLWGGTVPVLVGLLTGVVVTAAAGLQAGVLALLPWLAGAFAAWAWGPYLPGPRLPRLRRRPAADRFLP